MDSHNVSEFLTAGEVAIEIRGREISRAFGICLPEVTIHLTRTGDNMSDLTATSRMTVIP